MHAGVLLFHHVYYSIYLCCGDVWRVGRSTDSIVQGEVKSMQGPVVFHVRYGSVILFIWAYYVDHKIVVAY